VTRPMIHVVGNATVDMTVRLESFPRPGETVVALGAAEDLGGKGANQAIVAARAGAPVRLVAAIGEDQRGDRFRRALSAEGVGTDGLATGFGSTDLCVISVDAKGENTVVSLIDAARAFDPIPIGLMGPIAKGDWVVMQGNLRAEVTRACLAVARERGATTALNPSPLYPPNDYDWRLVDLAILNRGEVAALGGSEDPFEAAGTLMTAGAGTVVVTLGAEGAILVSPDETLRVSAPRVIALDTTGAGDVFCGTLVAARSRGRAWPEGLEAASRAAASSVQRRGVFAAFPARAEMASILSETCLVEQKR